MYRSLKVQLAALSVVALCTAGLAAQPGKGKTVPDGVPLELRLVSQKDSYVLDLGGKKADEFRKLLKEKGGKLPAPPKVDLVFELRNTGKKDLKVWIAGDATEYDMDLKGPGAVSVSPNVSVTTDVRPAKWVSLAAGEARKVGFGTLKYGYRGVAKQAYFTEPGEYTLTVSFKTGVSPAPKGSEKVEGGFGKVTIISAPVKLTVKAR
jgi:hypothetical protein